MADSGIDKVLQHSTESASVHRDRRRALTEMPARVVVKDRRRKWRPPNVERRALIALSQADLARAAVVRHWLRTSRRASWRSGRPISGLSPEEPLLHRRNRLSRPRL